MTFVLNDIDFSDKVEVTGYRVIPRKVTGGAAGYLLNGDHLADLLSDKTDLSVNIVATEEEDTSKIAYICTGEYVRLKFSDPVLGKVWEDYYEPQISGIEMAIDTNSKEKRYWYGFSIKFTQR